MYCRECNEARRRKKFRNALYSKPSKLYNESRKDLNDPMVGKFGNKKKEENR